MSIFWVHASNPERLKTSYFDIAKRVNIPGWDNPLVNVFQLVKGWFEGEVSGRWLLVIDNADNMEMLYGPDSKNLARYGKVGIKFATARNTISISALSPEESEQFLASRIGDVLSEVDYYSQLAEELENFPLALVQASSFIKENQISVARYLELYRENDLSKTCLLSEHFEDDTRDPEIKNSVATTWAISFDYIRAHDPIAADVLSLMSMLDREAIPEPMLSFDHDRLILERLWVL